MDFFPSVDPGLIETILKETNYNPDEAASRISDLVEFSRSGVGDDDDGGDDDVQSPQKKRHRPPTAGESKFKFKD